MILLPPPRPDEKWHLECPVCDSYDIAMYTEQDDPAYPVTCSCQDCGAEGDIEDFRVSN